MQYIEKEIRQKNVVPFFQLVKKCRAFFSVGKKNVVPFFQLCNYCDHIFEAYIIFLT